MKTAEEYSDDVTKWEPPFYAEIDENAEDSDEEIKAAEEMGI